jgi:lipopolysaccharide transport system permease protein
MSIENPGVSAARLPNRTPMLPESSYSSSILPKEPLIKIRPSRPWSFIDLRDVWAHRELFFFLVWRDVKVRYKQTLLGALWVILQPLLMTLIFMVFLGMLVRVPTPGMPYPVFLYAALLPWTFFSNAVASSSFSLVASASMITKVYFPRVLIPAAMVAVRLSDFLIAFVILAGLLVYYHIHPTWALLVLPLLVAHLTILAITIGLLLSSINVKYRDVGTMIPVMLQLWMFVSPIVYPSILVPPRWKIVYELNPLAGIIENFRACLFGLPFNRSGLMISALITLTLLIYSAHVFRRMEDEFADVI